MIEQLTPIGEIPGLESLVGYLRREYGEELVAKIRDQKLRIGISLYPPTTLSWGRDQYERNAYTIKAVQGHITGY